uniref:CHRD domain-containing protein n=1 Tax=Pseudo-nitzschia australis TaxID=44445 RepID=A0A7S4AWZ8_9STRA|mmetsp:Transcript_25702/g.56362  ORF Transcript_25702/g.56362 Transcript_25702/m.56362 type:complete len:194 (+) Transcript_25702:63-644(+)|eukprot:CAMPEP_0168162940 /NCGR_PEP_ID=MMETSP0139_2-20121125/99_1 /TAXON_ID=44445 /ORGANISM="Pseudo-nitzschia australis, Strain 10249 10 AB" /LENGTH=193 /DNA_ID=CAMNT_0008079779 /DNA_START=63 /DNA_END=644 /DNA_ORIENTATION=-
MNIFLSSTILASVMAPAYSFSYLDTLNAAPVAAAPVAAAPVAPAPVAPAPVAAAPAAPYTPAPAADIEPGANYFDSLSTGAEVRGPGLMTHVDHLNTGASSLHGAGIHTYAEALVSTSAFEGGVGIHTYCDDLSPTTGTKSPSPFGSSVAASISSTDGVTFTLTTGDISGLVSDLKAGAKLTLSGSIDSISTN